MKKSVTITSLKKDVKDLKKDNEKLAERNESLYKDVLRYERLIKDYDERLDTLNRISSDLAYERGRVNGVLTILDKMLIDTNISFKKIDNDQLDYLKDNWERNLCKHLD